MENTEPINKLNWFNGDQSALDLYERFSFVSHILDDLIDKDKPVSDLQINVFAENMILFIPGNPFFKRFETEIRALIVTGLASYKAANLMESSGNDHALEIAHYLRYMVSSIGVFMISVTNGLDKAPAIIAEALPHMITERLSDYVKEHSNGRR